MTGEGRCGQLDGLAREQGLLAAAAVGTIRELGGRHAVDGLAMRADEVKIILHGSPPWTTVRLPRFGSQTMPTNQRLGANRSRFCLLRPLPDEQR